MFTYDKLYLNFTSFYLQILDLLGPKTEADLAPPPKVEKKPKGDGGKKTKKPEDKGEIFLLLLILNSKK